MVIYSNEDVTWNYFTGEREKGTVYDKNNGQYLVEYTPSLPVFHGFTVTINGTAIPLPYDNVHIFNGNFFRVTIN